MLNSLVRGGCRDQTQRAASRELIVRARAARAALTDMFIGSRQVDQVGHMLTAVKAFSSSS